MKKEINQKEDVEMKDEEKQKEEEEMKQKEDIEMKDEEKQKEEKEKKKKEEKKKKQKEEEKEKKQKEEEKEKKKEEEKENQKEEEKENQNEEEKKKKKEEKKKKQKEEEKEKKKKAEEAILKCPVCNVNRTFTKSELTDHLKNCHVLCFRKKLKRLNNDVESLKLIIKDIKTLYGLFEDLGIQDNNDELVAQYLANKEYLKTVLKKKAYNP